MPVSVVDAALRYAQQGWPVVPLNGKLPLTPHGYKDGSTDPNQIRLWWQEHPAAWAGIVVGERSGLCVLDVDLKPGGFESLKRLTEEHGRLPDTPTVSTAGGGRHYYFRYSEAAVRSTIAPGLEIKARDGYVVAPPSCNPTTGVAYKWTTPKGTFLAELPPWLLGGSRVITVAASCAAMDAGPIPEGERDSTLTSIAGALHRRGLSEEAVGAALLAENRARCLPPLLDAQVEKIARSVARYPAPAPARVRGQPLWPNPPGPAAYRGLAGEFVHLIEEHTESDPAALLVQFLVGFGSLVGRSPHFAVEADRHPANEFALLVGDTSKGRKGTAWGQALRPLRAVDPIWAESRQQGGLSSGEGLIWAVRDAIQVQSPIREKGRVVGYEEVIQDPGVTDKRLLVFEPEFASTLRVMGRDGSTLSPVVRQAWDSGDLRVLTKNSPARATGAHISLIGHVTRDELLRYLDRTEAANGFINRFLIVCVKRARLLPEGGRLDELDVQPLLADLRRAVEWSTGRAQLVRDEEARALWHEVYAELSEGRPGLLGAVISRAEAHVVRLSLLYALLDGADKIGRPHLEAALELWSYADASARYVFGDALGSPVADELLATLRLHTEGLTRTEISSHFGRHARMEEIGRALATLQGRGLVRTSRDETGGRVAERWSAVGDGDAVSVAPGAPAVPPCITPEPVRSGPAGGTEARPGSLLSHNSLPSQPAGGAEDLPGASGGPPGGIAPGEEERTWTG